MNKRGLSLVEVLGYAGIVILGMVLILGIYSILSGKMENASEFIKQFLGIR